MRFQIWFSAATLRAAGADGIEAVDDGFDGNHGFGGFLFLLGQEGIVGGGSAENGFGGGEDGVGGDDGDTRGVGEVDHFGFYF